MLARNSALRRAETTCSSTEVKTRQVCGEHGSVQVCAACRSKQVRRVEGQVGTSESERELQRSTRECAARPWSTCKSPLHTGTPIRSAHTGAKADSARAMHASHTQS